MKVLLDTNVLIPLESSPNELDPNLAEIVKLSSEQQVQLVIHPMQFEDVNNDKDEPRRKRLSSHLEKYTQIENPPEWTKADSEKLRINESKSNDVIDNNLLNSVYRNAVSFLITEDKGIHKKAKIFGVQERVFYIATFLEYLKSNSKEETQPPLGIEECHVHQLKIEDGFFGTLRKAYEEFEEWFAKIAREGRRAWRVVVDDRLMALVIWKEENNPQITSDTRLDGKVLKLCTFKVSPDYRGRKIGERLLHTAFNYAVDNEYDYVYLTAVEEEQNMLISMCDDFGFSLSGKDIKTNDDVYVKQMKEPAEVDSVDNLEYAIRYYPHYRKNKVDKWIIPIRPEFHKMLFPDKQQLTLFDNMPEMLSSYSNTIKKAYISNAPITQIEPGDLAYFYRSGDEQSVRVVGIVEKAFHSEDASIIWQEIAKRTVYTYEQVEDIAKKNTLVILFRLLEYLEKPKSLKALVGNGNINAAPQTIQQMKGDI